MSSQGNTLFEANPGGAPCNVLAMLTKLGKKTVFIGKVGQEQFGQTLKTILDGLGINSDGLILDHEVPTTLAFVHTFADGDRDFSFYRKPGADIMLSEFEVNEDIIKSSKVFHFGTLSLTDEIVRKATQKAVRIAKENNLLITFDSNPRPPLWKSLDEAKEQFHFGLAQCDVVKMSEVELEFITDIKDTVEAVNHLRSQYSIPLILITMGAGGSLGFYKNLQVERPAFLHQNTIETTGAGDTFFGLIINYVLEYGLENLSEAKLIDILTFANTAASLITTKKGALRVMPEKQELILE